jgi:hypothetical protein
MQVVVVAAESFLGAVEGSASVEIIEEADRAGTLRQPIPNAAKQMI